MQIIGPAVATSGVIIGICAVWALGVSVLAHVDAPQPIAIFGPIGALLYCSARW